jgi:phosphatidylserine decarboxylase
MRLLGNILTGVQYLLPHHLLSSLVHWFMRIRIKVIKNTQISLIGELVGVDWSESKLKSASDYENFNAFFTRELAPGARPVDPDPATFVTPSDGRISQCGRLTNDRILQAKGRHYTLRSLLADNRAVSNFYNGFFHTIYLSPRDYHRVHMPMSGHLQGMIHVPGRLFSVAPYNVSRVPDIFARNERVISLFDTRHGPMAIILVGAMLVSSIETTWSGVITPPSGKRVSTTDWSRRNIHLVKGQEMGRFNMGSTVIVLLPANAVSKLEHYEPDDIVDMGQKLGRLL